MFRPWKLFSVVEVEKWNERQTVPIICQENKQ